MAAKKHALRFEATDIDVRGHVLARLAKELSTIKAVTGADAISSHIKNSCDIHGKGSHIKGAGPNYLKTSDPKLVGFDVSNPEIDRFIDAIAARVEARLAQH